MSDISVIPFESITLDPRNEETLVAQAMIRLREASAEQISNFSENSPETALLQAQAFAGSELLYYVNKLPLALVLEFLKVTGVERSLGTKARTTLTFTLTAPQSNSFVVPQNFEVVDFTGTYSFFTDTILVIPPGLLSGSVTATAEEVGTSYNLAENSITNPSQNLNYLNSVTNLEATIPGTDEELVDSTILRIIDQLSKKNLVSADDYERAAEQILGQGSSAKAIGLLAANKLTKELGAVHLFLLNANKQPASTSELSLVKNSLQGRIQLGTNLYTSPMEILPVSGELVARLVAGENPEETIDELWGAFQDYLNPSTYAVGADVILNEVEYQLRLSGGIKDIQSLILNGVASNVANPNSYTVPQAYSLYVRLAGIDGIYYEAVRGAGETSLFGGD
ncbi:baseplate J/gp47 family protein [Nostoc sp. FACHB-973]|nr:baseplate J/gp47 family protein [Nostoc sp. FACHB-973]